MPVSYDVGLVEADFAPLLAYERRTFDLTPNIRIQEPAVRALQSIKLQSLLNDIDTTRNAITALVGKLERLSLVLRRQEAAVKAALSPVMGIPPEILRDIFLVVMAQAPYSRTSLTLSHVNSHWRAISLGTRELWTIIQVPDHLAGSDMFNEFSLRSGNLPLHIAKLPPRPWVPTPLATKSAPEQLPRFSSVALQSGASSALWLFSLRSSGIPMSLENLTLVHHPLETRRPMFHIDYTVTTRSLRIEGDCLSIGVGGGIEGLEELSISNGTYPGIGWLLRQLRGAPLLKQLELYDVYGFMGEEEDDVMQIDLQGCDHCIEMLAIDGCDCGVWFAMENWSMPNLTELTVSTTEEDEYDIPRLARNWGSIFRDSVNLETINLRTSGYHLTAFCDFLLGTHEQGYPLPKLRYLNISAYYIDQEQINAFVRILEARGSPDSGIAKLRHLGVSEELVPAEMEERLRAAVETLIILPPRIWPPTWTKSLLGSVENISCCIVSPRFE